MIGHEVDIFVKFGSEDDAPYRPRPLELQNRVDASKKKVSSMVNTRADYCFNNVRRSFLLGSTL